MGVTKKPAVVAKTAPKKRGRPVGSKSKPKLHIGDPVAKSSINWEKLAKDLQKALVLEMKANESLQDLFDEFKSKIIIAETMPLWKRIRFVITGTL